MRNHTLRTFINSLVYIYQSEKIAIKIARLHVKKHKVLLSWISLRSEIVDSEKIYNLWLCVRSGPKISSMPCKLSSLLISLEIHCLPRSLNKEIFG